MRADTDTLVLKIARANQQHATLVGEVGTYLQNRGILGEFDTETSCYVFRFDGDPPPMSWGVAVGEIAHNLRSALDNLIWTLVETRGKKPKRTNKFPILKDKSWKTSRNGKEVTVTAESEIQRVTKGISGDDRAFIQAAQPYQSGEYAARHPLALLQYLNNVDKHEFIHPACACQTLSHHGAEKVYAMCEETARYLLKDVPAGTIVAVEGPAPPRAANADAGVITKIQWGGSSYDRTEVCRVPLTPEGPNPLVTMEPTSAITVSLSDRKRPILVSDIADIGIEVERVVRHFAEIIG